jgi:hypothetical protein
MSEGHHLTKSENLIGEILIFIGFINTIYHELRIDFDCYFWTNRMCVVKLNSFVFKLKRLASILSKLMSGGNEK